MSLKTLSLSAFAVAALVGAAVPAAYAADSFTQVRSLSVKFDDLDLRTAVGKNTLQHRINQAVKVVCGPNDTKNLKASAEYDACRTQAMATVTRQVDTAIAQADSDRQVAQTTGAAVH